MEVLNIFSKAIENSRPLSVLFLGALLLSIAAPDKIPYGESFITLSVNYRRLFSLIGIISLIYGFVLIGQNENRESRIVRDKANMSEQASIIRKKQKEIDNGKNQIKALKERLEAVKSLAHENKYTDVLSILSDIEKVVDKKEERWKILYEAADWVDRKSDSRTWMDAIRASEFREYGIERKNIKDFQEEICGHIRVLSENLRDMIPGGIPKNRGVSQKTASNPLAYRKALQEVFYRIDQDLENTPELSEAAKSQIRQYMEKLIEVSGEYSQSSD